MSAAENSGGDNRPRIGGVAVRQVEQIEEAADAHVTRRRDLRVDRRDASGWRRQ